MFWIRNINVTTVKIIRNARLSDIKTANTAPIISKIFKQPLDTLYLHHTYKLLFYFLNNIHKHIEINQKLTFIDNLRYFRIFLQNANWLMHLPVRKNSCPHLHLEILQIFYVIFFFVLFFISHDSHFIGYAQFRYVCALLLLSVAAVRQTTM